MFLGQGGGVPRSAKKSHRLRYIIYKSQLGVDFVHFGISWPFFCHIFLPRLAFFPYLANFRHFGGSYWSFIGSFFLIFIINCKKTSVKRAYAKKNSQLNHAIFLIVIEHHIRKDLRLTWGGRWTRERFEKGSERRTVAEETWS